MQPVVFCHILQWYLKAVVLPVCSYTYICILGPHPLMPCNSPRHLYQGQHIQSSFHSRCDLISKRARKTFHQKSRSWYSYFTVVAPQLLSESHLQYCPQMGLTGLEYSWILPVKWQSRNKIKETNFSPRIFFGVALWGFFFRNIKLPQCCGSFFRRSCIRTKTPACTILPLPSIWFPSLLLDIWKCLLKL